MPFRCFLRFKHCSTEIKFFQSSTPYLNNQSLTKFSDNWKVKFYRNEDPHPSQQRDSFLSIDHGHYGLYYTIFNHDTDKKRKSRINVIQFNPLLKINNNSPFNMKASFFILKINRDISNNISDIKLKSKQFLSTSSLVTTRNYSTKSKGFVNDPSPQVTEFDDHIYDVSENEIDTFGMNQLKMILTIYNDNDPETLNLIYPIYQSLKRNDIRLPSTDSYNMVLESILSRNLHSQLSVEDIETRLTNLLSIYQDLLDNSNGDLKPNDETFNFVLNGLMTGSLQAIEITKLKNLPMHSYHNSYIKSQEFCLIALDLISSIKNTSNLDLNTILPVLVTVLNTFPNLINKNNLGFIKDTIHNNDSIEYYVGLINLTKYFEQHELIKTGEGYEFMESIYKLYQMNCESRPTLSTHKYDIYEAMIAGLIEIGRVNYSTKFLDNILINYKQSHQEKSNISKLLSTYVTKYSQFDLDGAYDLMKKFNRVNYLPELSMDCYNNIMDQYINKYYSLPYDQVELHQEVYQKIWSLCNYNMIRKDFKLNENLISLTIDVNDYDNLFKLIKYILLSDELVQNTNAFKKLNDYLFNGILNGGDFYNYYDLIWNLIEHQSKYYTANNMLNNYLSEMTRYLVFDHPQNVVMFKYIINSPMVERAYKFFDLINDDIKGIMSILKLLMKFTELNFVDREDMLKVLNLQSYFINQFEDPEVVYSTLDKNLFQFKEEMNNNFIMNLPKVDNYSRSIKETLRFFNIKDDNKLSKEVKPEVNLSLLLNLNYDLGAKKFIETMNEVNFNRTTLMMLINIQFLTNNKLNLNKFINMVISKENPQELLNLIIKQNLDKVNIEIIKKIRHTDLINDMIIKESLRNTLSNSNNIYFHKLFNEVYNESVNDELKEIDFDTTVGHKHTSMTQLSDDIYHHLYNEEKLNEIYKLNHSLINLNQQIIMSNLLIRLIRNNDDFTALKYYCQMINNKLSIPNFIKLIKLLTNLNHDSQLSLLLTKLLNSDFVKFYFFEVLINDNNDKLKIMKLLKLSFEQLKCSINVHRLDSLINDNEMCI